MTEQVVAVPAKPVDASLSGAGSPVTVDQGTSPWVVSGAVSISGPVTVAQPVTVNQGTTPWVISGAVTQGTSPWVVSGTVAVSGVSGTVAVTQSTSPWVVSGTVTSNQGTSPWVVNGTVAATQSGTWTVQQGSAPWSVSQSGTWTVQAAQSGSWTVAATQSGTWTTGRTWTLASGTDSVAAVQSGTWNINNISGTVSLPTGAATAANQATEIASLASIDAGIPAALGQTTMASSMPVTLASNQTALPVSQSGSWTTQSAQSGAWTVAATQSGAWSVTSVPGTPTKKYYGATALNVASATLATDVFTVTGAASQVIRILKIYVSCFATNNLSNLNVLLIKRSAANTGGTSANSTNVPFDSNYAAATATVRSYTANPTGLGAAVGTFGAQRIFVSGATANPAQDLVWDFTTAYAQPIVLRSASEVLAINFGATTIAGSAFTFAVEWVED